MSHQERTPRAIPSEIVPASQAAITPRDFDDAPRDALPPASGRKISAKLVLRAMRRHWWQAALVWLVGSSGLVYLAYAKVKPTFDAFSAIRVEPAPGACSPRIRRPSTSRSSRRRKSSG